MQVSKRERKGAQKLTSRRFHHNKESGSMSFGVRETRFCSRFFLSSNAMQVSTVSRVCLWRRSGQAAENLEDGEQPL